MVRRTMVAMIEVRNPGESVALARSIIQWLEENPPYERVKVVAPEGFPRASGGGGGGSGRLAPLNQMGASSSHILVTERVPGMFCGLCASSEQMEAVYEHDATAPRLHVECKSRRFRYFAVTWQVIEFARDGKTVLEVRGDLIAEPRWWSPSSVLLVRETIAFQLELLQRLKRYMEVHQLVHSKRQLTIVKEIEVETESLPG